MIAESQANFAYKPEQQESILKAPENFTYFEYADKHILTYLNIFHKACYGMLFLILALNMISWLLPASQSLLPGHWYQMQSNTAMALLLCALLTFVSRIQGLGMKVLIQLGLFLLVSVLLCNSIVLHRSGENHNFINTLLVSASKSDLVFPVSYQSILSIFVLSCVPLLDRDKPVFSLGHDFLNIVGLCLAFFFILSHIFSASAFVGQNANVLISAYTLVCITLLVLINIAGKSRESIFSVFVSKGSGGQICRTILPVVAFLIFFLLSIQQHLLEIQFITLSESFALIATFTICGIILTIIYLSRDIDIYAFKLEASALMDELTGLLNLRGFNMLAEQSMKDARRNLYTLKLIYFDIDGLKAVNDKYGHKRGSEIIQTFARSLAKVFRSNDIVARVGGDEFVVLARSDNEKSDEMVRLNQTVKNSEIVDYRVKFSAGVVIIKPENQDSLENIIQMADQAMYEDKRAKGAQ